MNVERLLLKSLRLIAALAACVAVQTTTLGQSTDEAMTQGGGEAAASESPWGWLKMPKVTLPKIEMPKMPADTLAPVKSSARKVGDGAKKAWEGTKELFTFGGSKGDQPSARVASNGEAPSMFQRMFGAKEKAPEGPQTITEWMSQPRVDQ